jgi:uncharacterized protein
MSELIDNAQKRRDALKELIQRYHDGEDPQKARHDLVELLGEVPYGEVVSVEQELLASGTEREKILSLCDVHADAVKQGKQAAEPDVPAGHPVDTFYKENRAIEFEMNMIGLLARELESLDETDDASERLGKIRTHVHSLMDVDKHYARKENLLFSFLEKHGITGPSNVMWAKDDEYRALLKQAVEKLASLKAATVGAVRAVVDLSVQPALSGLRDMITREDNILWPMALEQLEEAEWIQVDRQSLEYGFCLYDPTDVWEPAEAAAGDAPEAETGRIQLPSGSLSPVELNAMLNSIPFDLTFVDKDDTVRYFTQGKERIFARSRAIIGRKVQLCHPPSSVHIVEQILEDFKSGKEDHAPFWIQMGGKFIHIEYYALRDKAGDYLGTLEVSQDLSNKRALEGEQRLLKYGEN